MQQKFKNKQPNKKTLYPAPLPPQIYISNIYFKTQKTKPEQNKTTTQNPPQ